MPSSPRSDAGRMALVSQPAARCRLRRHRLSERCAAHRRLRNAAVGGAASGPAAAGRLAAARRGRRGGDLRPAGVRSGPMDRASMTRPSGAGDTVALDIQRRAGDGFGGETLGLGRRQADDRAVLQQRAVQLAPRAVQLRLDAALAVSGCSRHADRGARRAGVGDGMPVASLLTDSACTIGIGAGPQAVDGHGVPRLYRVDQCGAEMGRQVDLGAVSQDQAVHVAARGQAVLRDLALDRRQLGGIVGRGVLREGRSWPFPPPARRRMECSAGSMRSALSPPCTSCDACPLCSNCRAKSQCNCDFHRLIRPPLGKTRRPLRGHPEFAFGTAGQPCTGCPGDIDRPAGRTSRPRRSARFHQSAAAWRPVRPLPWSPWWRRCTPTPVARPRRGNPVPSARTGTPMR